MPTHEEVAAQLEAVAEGIDNDTTAVGAAILSALPDLMLAIDTLDKSIVEMTTAAASIRIKLESARDVNTFVGNTIEAGMGIHSSGIRIAAGQVRALTPAPPVPAVKALIGAATTRTGGWTALEALCGGPLAVRRSFNNSTFGLQALSNTAMYSDIAAKRRSVYSFKTTTASMASGAQDAALAKLVDAIEAAQHPTWLCWRHEPEDDGEPAAPWVSAFNRFAAKALRPHVTPTAIYIGWTWDSRSGRNPADWLPADRNVCIGLDPYNLGDTAGASNDQDPAELFDPILVDLRKRGYHRFGIAETGIKNTVSAARRLEWMKQLRSWASVQTDVEYVCYFDSDVGTIGDWWLDAPMAKTLLG